jgi:hypothetical protein
VDNCDASNSGTSADNKIRSFCCAYNHFHIPVSLLYGNDHCQRSQANRHSTLAVQNVPATLKGELCGGSFVNIPPLSVGHWHYHCPRPSQKAVRQPSIAGQKKVSRPNLTKSKMECQGLRDAKIQPAQTLTLPNKFVKQMAVYYLPHFQEAMSLPMPGITV